MQSKKLIVGLGILVVLVAAAAFIAGRMINSEIGPLGLFGLPGTGDKMRIAVKVIPAPELPTIRPEVMGLVTERKDNSILVAGKGLGGGAGSTVEIVVTNETMIYRETTQVSKRPSGENQTVQQTVEQATLDDLKTEDMVMVWGRKSGDRIIAEVLMYSSNVMIKKP
ncbi:MAG TPA: hypothetical protein VFR47_30130 [Anaerolineales bacterium]|nr:hypothetical protein [Anaerolineales bacterium]